MSTDLERAIPPELAHQGVAIVQEANGYRAISIPASVRRNHNVLMPVESFAAADVLYTPSINRVMLNVVEHGYERERDKYDLTKNGLLALADAAGIAFPRTERMPRTQLLESEIGWQATVTIRRSDGTITAYVASRIVDLAVEREKVKAQCLDQQGNLRAAYFGKRWGQERDVADAKAETKAVLRAVAQALKVKRGPYTREQFEKPWLVVSYNFTPDYSDPQTRRLAIEHGYAARSALYAPPAEDEQYAPEPQQAAPREVVRVELARDYDDDDDPGFLEAEEVEAVVVAPAPKPPPPKPAPKQQQASSDDGIEELLGRTFSGGKHRGELWRDVAENDPAYFSYVAGNGMTEQTRHDAARVVSALQDGAS